MVFVCSFMFLGNLFSLCAPISSEYQVSLPFHFPTDNHRVITSPEVCNMLCITITTNAACERLQGLSLDSGVCCVGAEKSTNSNSAADTIMVWLVMFLSAVPSHTFVYTGIWCFFGKSDVTRKRPWLARYSDTSSTVAHYNFYRQKAAIALV